ncbi:MAG: class I SAM-dependent methyltransferase [Candidatus Omnitrophica bacterium]|nr:class I SAM-dependent methyltransferase [Candidatus Omnitrophota bacterium]
MEDSFFINHPIFLKYKRRFDWRSFKRKPFIKKALLNERIIEIPFAINALAGMARDSKILDLGCMESVLPLFLSGLGFQVTGFDFRRYPYQAPNFKFVQGSILDLPFSKGFFNAITCVSTIEHIGIGFYSDPKENMSSDVKAMLEIRRVLKPAGLLILTVPFGRALINNQQRIYDKQGLDRLMDGFSVNTIKFFKNHQVSSGNNYWEEISLQQAASASYTSGTECICCLSALRIN